MRYFRVTLIFGLLTTVAAGAIYQYQVLLPMDRQLAGFLGVSFTPSVLDAPIQFATIIFFAFGIAWTTIDVGRVISKCIIALGAIVEVIGAVWALNFFHIFFSPFAALIAILLSFFLALVYSRSEAGKRKRILRLMFGERVSRKTFYALVNSDAPPNFEGEMREATVVLCEIFNHEELMDALTTSDYVAASNMFLRTGADFLVEKGGYLDECDGESLRVLFGAPLENKAHAAVACAAALELTQRFENLNHECEEKLHKRIDFRIGINSGEMVTAAYGSRRLGTYSVAGEPVEFARRLSALNLKYGSRLLIGSRTFELAEDAVEIRPMEMLDGRNGNSREEIYELLAMKEGLSSEERKRRDLYWKGIVLYREQQWDEALAHFNEANSNGSDAPLAFYIRRVEEMQQQMRRGSNV
jgi:adenylate cyclase